jgi:hypothetical protein
LQCALLVSATSETSRQKEVHTVQVDGFASALRCGMSRDEVTRAAVRFGYDKCLTPADTSAGFTSACASGDHWAVFRFDDGGLNSFQTGTMINSERRDTTGSADGEVRLCDPGLSTRNP